MRGHTRWVEGVIHLPGGRRIITCSADSSLQLWDLESGAQIGESWRDQNIVGVRSMALSPNGKMVASGSEDEKVRLWDVETKEAIARNTDLVRLVCWSADDNQVASGSWAGAARVWPDVASNKAVLTIKNGHKHVLAVMYSPDSTKTCRDKENAVKIWDAETGELFSTLEHHNIVVCSLA